MGTIVEALDSVKAQSYTDYEIIVVDDASSDDTLAVVREALPPSANHRIIDIPSNGGPAATRNAGIASARGEWIAFLDGDDVWLPWRLEFQLDIAETHEGVEALCGNVSEMSDEVSAPVAEGRAAYTELDARSFAIRNRVATSTVLVRRQAVLDVGGFDPAFRGPEDYDLWVRLAARRPWVKCNDPLSRYREVQGSLSRSDMTFLPQVLRVLDKAYGPGGALEGVPAKRRAQAYQYLCAAWMAAERGVHGRAWAHVLMSLARWPFSFEPYEKLPWCRAKLAVGIMKSWVRRG